MVLKAPETPSVVFRRDACREARILDAAERMGAPVPGIIAIDEGATAVGRPCFVMGFVDGRSVNDSSAGSYHDDEWLRDAGEDTQRAVWESFHDALAALHGVDASKIPGLHFGATSTYDVLEYWTESLVDAAPAETVPRQLAALDWLATNLPRGADDELALCMGDARLVNGLIAGTEVRALVDFEVAYVGNPAADIAYSLFLDSQSRGHAAHPLPGIPSAEVTWKRWAQKTGRDLVDLDYWTAFGVTVIAITATRAMIQWGMAGPSIEDSNPLVAAWEALIKKAATS